MKDEVEVGLLTTGAADRWFCLTPGYEKTADGRVLIGGTLRDISAPKAYQANADAFNARKNVVLEILSHDLSGSFALVEQIADFLHREVSAPVESRIPELLRVLETTSQSSRRMIRDLIEVEFLASANTDLKRSRVDVAAVLRVSLDQLQQGQELLGQRFTYSLPTEPVYANLDVNKFTQVLSNLVSNALKFTPDGGQVHVAVEPCPGCVRLHVQDSGIGIPAAVFLKEVAEDPVELFKVADRTYMRRNWDAPVQLAQNPADATRHLLIQMPHTLPRYKHARLAPGEQVPTGSPGARSSKLWRFINKPKPKIPMRPPFRKGTSTKLAISC